MMQNCDLPPPLKVFPGYDDKRVITSMNKICSSLIGSEEKGSCEFSNNITYRQGQGDKLELLKALQLSQTRAREAERRYEEVAKERDLFANALLKESLHISGSRNWTRLLEVQLTLMQFQMNPEEKPIKCCCSSYRKLEEAQREDGVEAKKLGGSKSWILGLTICCVGIAAGASYYAFTCRF